MRWLKILLWIGALFFYIEFVLHIGGLPILEHDRIFLYTHDRYIALFSLTYGTLLMLISRDIQKYRTLFLLTMCGILLSIINGVAISLQGGYASLFPVSNLDKNLKVLGMSFLVWYITIWIVWLQNNRMSSNKMNGAKKNIEQNVKLFDKWAASYDFSLFQWWMRRFYRPVLDWISGNQRILDVSCGTGNFLQEMQQRFTQAGLYGCDISEKMIEQARKKLSTEVKLSTGNVHDLKYKSDYFDCVTSTEAFHHYYDQEKALSEMRRVTKKDGRVIVSDINFFFKPVHWLFERLEPGCVKINSDNEMKALFEKAGLRVVHQKRSWVFAIITVGMKS